MTGPKHQQTKSLFSPAGTETGRRALPSSRRDKTPSANQGRDRQSAKGHNETSWPPTRVRDGVMALTLVAAPLRNGLLRAGALLLLAALSCPASCANATGWSVFAV